MKVTPIASPLPGEHLVAVWPTPKPDSPGQGMQRLNFWSGRALTADALELEQEARAGRLARRGQITTAGIVNGLGVALETPSPVPEVFSNEGHFLHVTPGYGVTASGEDVIVPRPLRLALKDIPLIVAPGTDIDRPAVLLLRPMELRSFDNFGGNEPCELDPSRDAFADERRLEICQLRLYPLPEDLLADATLGDPNDLRWRNRLAALLMSAEAARARRQHATYFDSLPAANRWSVTLRAGEPAPWELEGLPLALIGVESLTSDGAQKRFFLDRASVARIGGLPHPRSRPAARLATKDGEVASAPPGVGTPALWRARVDQFAEHLADFADEAPAQQATHFQFLPPAGLLPRAALNFLTTEQARALVAPGQTPDRADVSRFFPANFAVEAVPVAIEDLDAALASSAPLAPYDLNTEAAELVRVLVPMPQRAFDPKALVVELPDPYFAAETNRLAATRQDWRQRREYVRTRSQLLEKILSGVAAVGNATRDDNQLEEAEPVESAEDYGFAQALLSPAAAASELQVNLKAPRAASASDSLFLVLHRDVEAESARVEFFATAGGNEYLLGALPDDFPQFAGMNASSEAAPAYALWRKWRVPLNVAGFANGDLTALKIKVTNGRVAVAGAGIRPADGEDTLLWSVGDELTSIVAPGGDWETLTGPRLAAPYEDDFAPVFADGKTLEQRKQEVDEAVNPAAATARAAALSVDTDGLEKVLAEIEAEANEADDFVDAHFTRAQTNLYRVRKLILGETAAQRLLINPAIATIAAQETAVASAEKLGEFLAAAKSRPVETAKFTAALLRAPKAPSTAPPGTRGPAPRGAGSAFGLASGKMSFVPQANPTVAKTGFFQQEVAGAKFSNPIETTPQFSSGRDPFTVADLRSDLSAFGGFKGKVGGGAVTPKPPGRQDILGQLPESGPTLPPRGLSIGKRFIEPVATENLSYARSALQSLLDLLQSLRLPLVNETIKSLRGEDVPLLSLQGRDKPDNANETAESVRNAALTKFWLPPDPPKDAAGNNVANLDEAEVTMTTLDLIETKSAILRIIERLVQQRRVALQRGQEMLAALRATDAAAQNRLALLETRLAEARHDVSVARALWKEEEDRVDGINTQRDQLLAREVKFLAYVRPRAVDASRRDLHSWRLESADTPTAVPACLRRHDDAPDPLAAYVQLFRSSPVGWFPEIAGKLQQLDTREKLLGLLAVTRESAVKFVAEPLALTFRTGFAPAVMTTFQSSFNRVQARRQIAVDRVVARPEILSWLDQRRAAEAHASLGDVMNGRHGQTELARAATAFLAQIEQVATCLHAEFGAVPPATRLRWVERYSQFDSPAPLRSLTALPGYGLLPRDHRRRFQEIVNWLFGRVNEADSDAFNLINDLVRLCLLLASHAPVNQIITGHLPRPTPVRPGVLIPIKPLNPSLVRAGMLFHVWKGSEVVARGRVEDLHEGEVSARVEEARASSLDETMRVQFVASALNVVKKLR